MYSNGSHTYGRAKAGRPARIYIQQLCEDTGCSPEDLPEAMNDREKWQEKVRDIRASGTTWWWFWWWLCIILLFYHYIIYHFILHFIISSYHYYFKIHTHTYKLVVFSYIREQYNGRSNWYDLSTRKLRAPHHQHTHTHTHTHTHIGDTYIIIGR